MAPFDAIYNSIKLACLVDMGIVRRPYIPKTEFINTSEKFAESGMVKFLNDCKYIAIDWETEGLNVGKDRTLQISYCADDSNGVRRSFVIDFAQIEGMDFNKLRHLMREPDKVWIIHNGQFDLQFAERDFGCGFIAFEDTLAMAMTINEDGKRNSLKPLAKYYHGAEDYEDEVKKYTGDDDKQQNWGKVPPEVLAQYAGLDAIYTLELFHLFNEMMTPKQKNLYRNMLHDGQGMFAQCSYHGVEVDKNYVEEVQEAKTVEIEGLRTELVEFAEEKGFDARDVVKKPKYNHLNPNSPKQLAYLFYDLMALTPPWPPYKKNGQPNRTTDNTFLEKYENIPIVKTLEKHRKTVKLKGTYLDGVLDDLDKNNRVHHSIKIGGAVTGRLSITDPPLQTIPRDKKFRKAGILIY